MSIFTIVFTKVNNLKPLQCQRKQNPSYYTRNVYTYIHMQSEYFVLHASTVHSAWEEMHNIMWNVFISRYQHKGHKALQWGVTHHKRFSENQELWVIRELVRSFQYLNDTQKKKTRWLTWCLKQCLFSMFSVCTSPRPVKRVKTDAQRCKPHKNLQKAHWFTYFSKTNIFYSVFYLTLHITTDREIRRCPLPAWRYVACSIMEAQQWKLNNGNSTRTYTRVNGWCMACFWKWWFP